jgi:hypothetical protein
MILEAIRMASRKQVSVIVDPEVRRFFEAKAAAEHRSLSNQLGHELAEAAKRESSEARP